MYGFLPKSGRKKTPGPGALSEFGTLAGRNSARGAAVTPKRKVPTGVGEGWEVGMVDGPTRTRIYGDTKFVFFQFSIKISEIGLKFLKLERQKKKKYATRTQYAP